MNDLISRQAALIKSFESALLEHKDGSIIQCSPEFVSMAVEILKALKAWHWIPVTERLPENLTSVIVHRKDGGIFLWEYFNTSPTDECWIDDSMNVYSFYDVTHWMPLPQPPKEETK